MPRNMGIAIAPMSSRVDAAFFACGRRKACTPSAMASTPVSAVAPDEKARRTRKSVRRTIGLSSRSAVSAVGHPPRQRTTP